ncbi:MAG: DHH family phosphoesterase [Gammaproteobacteria bacterium]|nr:MAG: DHH family phosphoesterase [Gammaproteobacteria bacterium]
MFIDIFNGDADGICALIQLRLEQPREAQLVTGVKRDINLLQRVDAGAGDELTVLDVSMAKNTADLQRLLAAGAQVLYIDHHLPGEIPQSPLLDALIDTSPEICTSLLVDQRLGGKYRAWAVTAAFGDNLDASAEAAAKPLSLGNADLQSLRQLGIAINYNGYGSSVADLHFAPDQLYRELVRYDSPLDYLADAGSSWSALLAGYEQDMTHLEALQPDYATEKLAVFILPREPWSKRVSGVFGNRLANEYPDRAHAVLSRNDSGAYTVSVRAPLNNRAGAGEFCSSFPGGGGRAAAAGINDLPVAQYGEFLRRFETAFG